MPAVLLMEACSNIVSNKLPFVRQKTHAIATEIAVTAMRYKRNDWPKLSLPGMKKKGKCQHAQITPNALLAPASPNCFVRRGSAYPRHPISSPAWTGVENMIATIIKYQGTCPNRGQVPRVSRFKSAAASLITAM